MAEPKQNGPWRLYDEFLPYHPSASHVPPEYRDGWNDCYRAADSTRKAASAQWMPIETAPKDGTLIIVADCADGQVYDVMHGFFEVLTEDEQDGAWDIRGGEPWCSYEGREAGTYFCNWLPGKELETRWKVEPGRFEYTHWMPLSAAPQKEKPE